jgi:CheY-like chemotaxis protein
MNAPSATAEINEALLAFPPQVRLLPPPKPRVLLADDDHGIRESLGKLLRNTGCQVTLVANGGQVLDHALNEDFDLLLLDLNMPQMDGWETLNHLQGFKPNLPVIVITAQPGQRDWMRDGGARALMEKPLDLPLLLRTVREFLDEPRQPEGEPAASESRPFRYLRSKSGDTASTARISGWGINE